MKFHYHLLINPASGGGKNKQLSQEIIGLLEKNNYLYTTYQTTYAGQERLFTKELLEQTLIPWKETSIDSETPFPLLIVMGGDGTLHQVIDECYQLRKEIPIAYIPAGSGNDFARGFGISREAKKAFWQIVKTQSPKTINILSYQEKISGDTGIILNNMGMGIDGAVIHQTTQTTTKKWLRHLHLGSMTYLFSVFSVLFKQKGFPILVEANGQTWNFKKAFLCTITNHPYFGGGIAIAPMANSAIANFEFVLVERHSMLKIFQLILMLLFKQQERSKHFIHFSTNRLRLVSTVPQYGQVDGEVIQKKPLDLLFTPIKQQIWL
ncbi:diacylglycerol/lipid kinase family protein [Enterococcus sp. LJL98]